MSNAEKNNSERAKSALISGKTLAVAFDDVLFTTEDRGIRPLLSLLSRGIPEGFAAADRIVGSAAAMLYILLRPACVYGEVMTNRAFSLLTSHGISASFGTLTDRIVNREGTGLCPMERAVEGIDDPDKARLAIERTLFSLSRPDPA